jgi:phage shock protein E
MLVSYPACEQGRRDEDHSVKIKIDSGALILDVRTPGEYQSWHFPGAVNVPLQQLEYRLRELGDLERPIIAYCTIGTRSHYAAMLLRSHGFRNVLNGGGLREMKQFERN